LVYNGNTSHPYAPPVPCVTSILNTNVTHVLWCFIADNYCTFIYIFIRTREHHSLTHYTKLEQSKC